MRIESNPIARLLQMQSSKTDGANRTGITRTADKLELSDKAKALQTARAALADAPAVRADRVAAIKQQLADGSYSVTPEEVADKLLQQ